MQVLDAAQLLQQVASAAVDVAAVVEGRHAAGPCKISASKAMTGLPALRQQLQQLAVQPGSWDALAEGSARLLPEDSVGSILSLQFVDTGQAAIHSDGHNGGMDDEYVNINTRKLLSELLQPSVCLLLCTRRGLLCYNLSSREAERSWIFGQEAGQLQCILSTADLQSVFQARSVCLMVRSQCCIA